MSRPANPFRSMRTLGWAVRRSFTGSPDPVQGGTVEADVWVAIEEETGKVIGAWEDPYAATHAASVYEEEQKLDCLVVQGTLVYEKK